MHLIAVATDDVGRRYEVDLTIPDEVVGSLSVNNVRARLQRAIQQTAEHAATNCYVADKDRALAALARQTDEGQEQVTAPRGPDQIAFAGTTQPAVEVPGTGGTGDNNPDQGQGNTGRRRGGR